MRIKWHQSFYRWQENLLSQVVTEEFMSILPNYFPHKSGHFPHSKELSDISYNLSCFFRLKFMIQKLRNRSLLSGCANRRYRGSSHRHACSIWCRVTLYYFWSSWFDRSPFIFISGRSIRQAASRYGWGGKYYAKLIMIIIKIIIQGWKIRCWGAKRVWRRCFNDQKSFSNGPIRTGSHAYY